MTKALLALALAIPSIGAHPPIDPPTPIELDTYSCENCFDEIYIDPIDIIDTLTRITFKFSFEAKPTEAATIEIMIINSSYIEDIASIPITKQRQTLTYNYYNEYTNASGSNVFTFQLKSQYGTDIRTMSAKRRAFKNISVTENGQQEETDKTITRYRKSTGTTDWISEKFRFSGYYDLIYQPANQPFNPCTFSFKYQCNDLIPIVFGPVYCFFRTADMSWFSEIGEDYEGIYRLLYLSPYYDQKSNEVTFACYDNFYVDPMTQRMFGKARQGLVKTDSLYFPPDAKENTKIFFRYTLSNLGANGVKIMATTTVVIMGKVMGNCGDSTYCIGTNEAYPDVEIGERIIH